MVAQLVVSGWQTVTLVVSMLRVSPGALATMIGWTFGVFDCGTEPLVPVLEAAGGAAADGAPAAPGPLPGAAVPGWEVADGVPPPPPQAAKAAQTNSRA
ncbi:hypothetical protein [Paraburkholderia aromaticivorans]|uniref:hypothetical protein n=1 Tax=Paraburkholderia aromaticivorans TaxID=2026199 RepID=UPI001FCA16A1|nr:hypothetical protein [Paraburkholderia aromaticivorans]